MPPHLYAPICSYAPYIHMPQGCTCPHMPPYSSMPLCFLEALHVVGVVMGSPLCWDTLPYITPVWGCLPFITPPHSVIGSLCIRYVSGISVCYVGISLLSGRVWGCFPHQLGVGASALEMSICSFLYIFCSALCLTF